MSICLGRLSRINVLMAGGAIMTSTAGVRSPFIFVLNLLEIIPEMVLASWFLIWDSWLGGKLSIILSMVWEALLVCKEVKTRCPVSAAVTTALIVSKSLISPTIMTLAFCLKVDRRALWKENVSW